MTGRWWCCCTLTLSLPALATLIAEFLTELDLHHVTLVCNDPPFPFGALSKRWVPDDLFRSWIHPLRHNPKVRNVPKPQQLLEWADQQRTFAGPVLIIWARHDKLMPPTHAQRLTDHFQNTQLVWIDNSRTLIPIDQPEALIDNLRTFLATHI